MFLQWHSFWYALGMDIQKINKRHFEETDSHYRVSMGLTSKLLSYKNGIFHLEVTMGHKWTKNYNATASEISHIWKTNHPELSHALGCKLFIIDLKKNKYKENFIKSGVHPGYDAYKGILFYKNYLN